MTSVDARPWSHLVQLYAVVETNPSEEMQGAAKSAQEAVEKASKASLSMGGEGINLPTASEQALNDSQNKVAIETMREQQKDTEVYALYKLNDEVVGMYLKDATAFTVFNDANIQANAQREAHQMGLANEEFDAFVSGKMEDAFRAEYGDAFEVVRYGYDEEAPKAGEFSDELFGSGSEFEQLQNMSAKLLMDPAQWAVMVERYQ